MSTEADAQSNEAVMREIAQLKQRVTALEEENEQKDERIAELERELENERQTRENLISTPADDENVEPGGVFIAGKPIFNMFDSRFREIESYGDDIDELGQKIRKEQEKRGSDDAYLQKQLTAIAEKAGVEVQDSDIMGDDKIRRAMKNGAADVESNPNDTDERAVALLRNIDRWGKGVSDKNGKRFVLTAPEVMERFEDARDENLQTVQVNRVFDKIEEWSQDSPRHVATDYSGNTNRLAVFIEGDV